MKIYLGPYREHISPLHIAGKILFWKDIDSNTVLNFASTLEKIGIRKVTDWINSKQTRKIKVRIDKYDTWGMGSHPCTYCSSYA